MVGNRWRMGAPLVVMVVAAAAWSTGHERSEPIEGVTGPLVGSTSTPSGRPAAPQAPPEVRRHGRLPQDALEPYQPTVHGGVVHLDQPVHDLSLRWTPDGWAHLGRSGPSEAGPLASSPGLGLVRMRSHVPGLEEPTSEGPEVGDCVQDASGSTLRHDCLHRAELVEGAVTSWWDNGEDGLRQGWTVLEAPSADHVRIEVEVQGAEVMIVEDVIRVGRQGHGLEGADLRAWDADGLALDLSLEQTDDGFALVADTENARFPIHVDPTWAPWTWSHRPSSPGDAVGSSVVRSLGDINGDGYEDVAIGWPRMDDGTAVDAGRVLVFEGTATGLPDTPDQTLIGSQAGAWFGQALGSGDVDGDGYDDLIVGAPHHTVSGVEKGKAFVYLGSSTGLSTTPDVTLTGGVADGQFGASVDIAGDVDGDGYDDVVVGRPFGSGGAVQLFLGDASGPSTAADETWSGTDASGDGRFGLSVAGIGDVNDDGYDDIAVGEPWYDDGSATVTWSDPVNQLGVIDNGSDRGRIHLFHGSSSGPGTTADEILEGSAYRKHLGLVVSPAGDVDGDGFDDLVASRKRRWSTQSGLTMGIYWYNWVMEGQAVVYRGGTTSMTLDATLYESDQEYDEYLGHDGTSFAASVAGVGDLDGDGYDDIAVGAPLWDGGQTNEGRVFVYRGGADGVDADWSWAVESDEVLGVEGSSAPGMGSSVAGAADITGTSEPSLLVGGHRAWRFEGDNVTAAEIEDMATQVVGFERWRYCLEGSDGPGVIDYYCWGEADIGRTVQGIGDVDGDGYDDLLVAGPSGSVGAGGYDGRLTIHLGGWDASFSEADAIIDADDLGAQLAGIDAAGVGDVDGDGFDDVVVGASGAAILLSGGADGLDADDAFDLTPGTITPAAYTFGQVVSGAGDLDQDGYADVIVAAPGSGSSQGLFVYLGGPTGLSVDPDVTIPAPASSVEFGSFVTGVGDLDGDGHPDVAVSDPDHDGGKGRVLVYRGTSGGLASSEWLTISGTASDGRLGEAVVGVGDLDGDGYDDIVVGEPGHEVAGQPQGRLLLFEGGSSMDATADQLLPRGESGALGGGLTVLQDADGDGHPEVVALTGAGRLGHRVAAFEGDGSQLDTTAVWSSPPWVLPFDHATTLDAAGDINGDGYEDLVVGVSGIPGSDDESGAYLWFGGPSGLQGAPTPGVILGMSDLVLENGNAYDMSVWVYGYESADVTFTWDLGTMGGTTLDHTASLQAIEAGVHEVTLTASTDEGELSSRTVEIVVFNPPPALSADAALTADVGVEYTAQITAEGPDGVDYVYTLEQGPGGASIDPQTGALTWTPSWAEAMVSPWVLEVSATDETGVSASWTHVLVVDGGTTDTDGDGLPDGWEEEYGLDPLVDDAALDDDLDGRTNAQELADGSDPSTWEGPSTPTPVWPAEGEEVATLNPVLAWTPSEHPLAYAQTFDVQVYDDEALTNLVASVSGLTSSTWSVDPSLVEDDWGWWQVRAHDGWASSPWSDASSLRVNALSSPPDTPVQIHPPHDGVAAEDPAVLQWTPSFDPDEDALAYDIRLMEEDGALVEVATNEAAEVWSPSTTLVEDHVYQWQIRAVDEEGMASAWSDVQAFRYSLEDGAPQGLALLEPVQDAAGVSTNPTFLLRAAVDPEGEDVEHVLELDTLPSFDGADALSVALPPAEDGTIRWSPADQGLELRDRADWYVRAQAVDVGGIASAFVTGAFRVGGPDLAPGAPTLLAPAEGESMWPGQTVRFVTNLPTDPDGDAVTVAIGLFTSDVADDPVAWSEGLTGDGGVVTELPIPEGHTELWWSAQATDATGKASPWSPPRRLDVTPRAATAGCETGPGGTLGLFLGATLMGWARRRRSGR